MTSDVTIYKCALRIRQNKNDSWFMNFILLTWANYCEEDLDYLSRYFETMLNNTRNSILKNLRCYFLSVKSNISPIPNNDKISHKPSWNESIRPKLSSAAIQRPSHLVSLKYLRQVSLPAAGETDVFRILSFDQGRKKLYEFLSSSVTLLLSTIWGLKQRQELCLKSTRLQPLSCKKLSRRLVLKRVGFHRREIR